MKTHNILTLSLSILLCLVMASASVSAQSSAKRNAAEKGMRMDMNTSSSAVQSDAFATAMRKLWEDHIVWTRNVILCLADDLPGTDQAVARLLQNQDDIGNAIKPYYGEDAGKKLTDLLYSHIKIAAEVVKAARSGNKDALDDAGKRWYANADDISAFLSSANPAWGLADMKKMMYDHLKLTTDEAVARLQKNYPGDILAYDKVHGEILEMADMLSSGIVKQFPAKFYTENQQKTAEKK
jgi:hypothetical protein